MTMNKLTIIRQEIERLKDELPEPDIKTIVGANALRQVTLLNRLLSFINSLDEPSHIGEGETVSASYDPDYLQSCIDKAKKSWEGVDVDEFMDEVRGREVNSSCIYGRSLEERKQSCKYCSAACAARIQDNSVVKENLTTETETDCHGLEAYDTEVWNWLKEHGTEETKQIIMMTARHFAEWGKNTTSCISENATNSEDLAKEIDVVSKRYPEVSFAKLSRIAKHFAEWGAEHFRDSTKMMDTELEEEIDRFEDWMESYNQSDYPTCISTRQIARHFAEWQKKQMMKEAVDGIVGFVTIRLCTPNFGEKYKEGDKVKLIVIPQDHD